MADFTNDVIKAAWDRQSGRCAKCGRWLVWAQRGRRSVTGAWESHHRNPEDQEGRNSLANCIVLCSGIVDCHFNVGHGGIEWSHHAHLDDSSLLYLKAGEEALNTTPPAPTRDSGSLIAAVFGIRQATDGRTRSVQKQTAKRGPRVHTAANSEKARRDKLSTEEG